MSEEIDNIVLPPAEVLKKMAELSIETITSDIAAMAERMADEPLTGHLRGDTALRVFASTIRSMNAKMYPKGKTQ